MRPTAHLPTFIGLLLADWAFVTANAGPGRQATRSEVALRAQGKRAGRLQPRTSSTSCAILKDDNGNCCSSDATVTISGNKCCDDAWFNNETCLSKVCCPYGASQLAIISSGVTPDNIPYRFGKCCTTGTVPVNSPGPNADCANVSRKRNELAFDLATRPVRRGATDDPLRQMTFREDSWRTRLSPHLLADYLLNDFQMEYRGHSFIDHHAKAQSGAAFRKQKAAEDPNFTMSKASPAIGAALTNAYEKGLRFIDIYQDWELAIEDLPEHFRAMMEHPKWNGVYYLHGQEYTEDTLRAIASAAPGFNATLHDKQ